MGQSLSRNNILEQLRIKRNKRFRLASIVTVLITFILLLPVLQYSLNVYIPYNKTALRVEESVFTRKDVVDFVRFNQRLSEEQGVQFNPGSSLFESLQLIAENEIAYLSAAQYGLTVEQWEIDEAFFIRLGIYDDIDLSLGEDKRAFQEQKIQFLNEVQLDDETYQDIVRKGIFREKLRRELSREIPLIQPHAEVYKILVSDAQPTMLSDIERRIQTGENLEEIISRFSEDPEVQKNKGSLGWIPVGIYPTLDNILFGQDENGKRNLNLRELSEPYINQESDLLEFYIISDLTEAKELSDEHMEQLSNDALTQFLSKKSLVVNIEYGLDNDTFNWINSRVQIASILPSSTISDEDDMDGVDSILNQ